MKLIVAFYQDQLCERGTSVAIYDYAYYNEKLLGNTSIIIYNKHSRLNNPQVIDKFTRQFKDIITIDNFKGLDNVLVNHSCNVLYLIKSGENDGKLSNKCKTVIHAVFNASQPHGDVYASISSSVGYYTDNIPIVPHMINLPNLSADINYRKRLSIPMDSIVFGRYGGYHQFDIKFVMQCIVMFAKEHLNVYFVFANTRPFCELDEKNGVFVSKDPQNIIFLPQIIDPLEKVKFINTCDAMIHARSDGETFGLSIGEFSSKNKPIITCKTGYLNHAKILDKRGFWYKNPWDLMDILNKFVNDIDEIRSTDWNCYKEYMPAQVMKQFEHVFLRI